MVTVLEIDSDESTSGIIAWNSAGYSMEPAATIVPWPSMRRGTDITVPIIPGFVSVILAPVRSSGDSLFVRALAISAS